MRYINELTDGERIVDFYFASKDKVWSHKKQAKIIFH